MNSTNGLLSLGELREGGPYFLVPGVPPTPNSL